jgi:hypothetical protein
MRWVTEAEMEALKAKVAAAKAAFAKADAEWVADNERYKQAVAAAEAEGHELMNAGPDAGRFWEARAAAEVELARAEKELADAKVNELYTLVTSDDPAPSQQDTGHYDDSHSFGWGTKKKAVVGVGIVAVLAGITAAIIALSAGG